jgi:hypothetical protein
MTNPLVVPPEHRAGKLNGALNGGGNFRLRG